MPADFNQVRVVQCATQLPGGELILLLGLDIGSPVGEYGRPREAAQGMTLDKDALLSKPTLPLQDRVTSHLSDGTEPGRSAYSTTCHRD